MVGSTRASFGAGAEILELITTDQSRRFVIENIHESSTYDDVTTALARRFPDIKDITLVQSAGSVTVIVTMSGLQAADDAVGFIKLAKPEGLREAPRKRLSVYSIPEIANAQRAHLSTTIEVSSHYPSRIAWAHYSSERKARNMADLTNGSEIKGRQIQCRFQQPVYYRPSSIFSVSISNLPEDISESSLVFHMKANDVTIKESTYTVRRFQTLVPRLLRQYGNLISFKLSPSKTGANEIFAFARFEMSKSSFDAVTALHAQKADGLGGSPLYLEIVSSIKYSVRTELWAVLEQEVRASLDQCNG